VTRQGQGIDAKSLADQTATAAAQMFTMAQARMRLVARIFAETGIKDLFLLLHGTIRIHDRQENTVRLRNKWIPINPRDWKTRDDMTVRVALTGSKDQQMAFLMNLLGLQEKALQSRPRQAGQHLQRPQEDCRNGRASSRLSRISPTLRLLAPMDSRSTRRRSRRPTRR
jgi:hypothetical protein